MPSCLPKHSTEVRLQTPGEASPENRPAPDPAAVHNDVVWPGPRGASACSVAPRGVPGDGQENRASLGRFTS
jgi:hypothetical protein